MPFARSVLYMFFRTWILIVCFCVVELINFAMRKYTWAVTQIYLKKYAHIIAQSSMLDHWALYDG